MTPSRSASTSRWADLHPNFIVRDASGRVMHEVEGRWNLSYKHPADMHSTPVFMRVGLDFLTEYMLRHWHDLFWPSFERLWCWVLTNDDDPTIILPLESPQPSQRFQMQSRGLRKSC